MHILQILLDGDKFVCLSRVLPRFQVLLQLWELPLLVRIDGVDLGSKLLPEVLQQLVEHYVRRPLWVVSCANSSR